MPPVGGEETAPVIETKKEHLDRLRNEEEVKKQQLVAERETKLQELAEIFRRRAILVNDMDKQDFKIRNSDANQGVEVLKITVGQKDGTEETFYQPLAFYGARRLVILTDGTIHTAEDDYMETISLETSGNKRFPLLPGLETDDKVAQLGDRLPMNKKTILSDGRTVMPERLMTLGHDENVTESLIGMERTLKLANKLANGTVLHYGSAESHYNVMTGLVPTS